MSLAQKTSALANEKRLAILAWLKDPHANFPPQVHGDMDLDGVCGVFIAEKLGVSAPTASTHLRLLVEAGLIRPKRLGKFTYFKRVEPAISALARDISNL